jgi:hypothetical protein
MVPTPEEVIAKSLDHCPTEQGADDECARIIISDLDAAGYVIAPKSFVRGTGPVALAYNKGAADGEGKGMR